MSEQQCLPQALEMTPGPFRCLATEIRLKLGKLAAVSALMLTGVTTILAGEETLQPAIAYADTLGYPDADMPCEHAPYNTTGACTDYDWGPVREGATSTTYSSRGYGYRNCTDYVAWRLGAYGVTVSKSLGNGGDWYDNAPDSQHAQQPKAGEAAVRPTTPADALGHLAFIDAVNQDGTITISEYNHDGTGVGDTRTGKPADLGFSKFIDFGVDPSRVQPPATAPPAPGTPHKRGDFTHDDKADIAWYERWKSTVSLLQSDGTAFRIQPFLTGIGGPDWAGVGDFDGNGFADIAWYEQWKNSITVMVNHGNNTFTLEDFMDGVGSPVWAGVGDFDGDGRDDLAWYEQSNNAVTILRSTNGRFQGWARIAGIGAPTWAGVGDFNGDNKADIAWYENWKTAITVFNGGSGFSPATWRTGIGGPDWAGVGDFDGDGKDDIAWYEQWKQSVTLWHSNGGNAFEQWGGIPHVGGPTWAGVGDFDGNGKEDIAWYENWKNAVTVFKSNQPGGGFAAQQFAAGIGGPDWAGGRSGGFPGSNGR